MVNILGTQTLDGLLILGVDANPSLDGGVPASVGSFGSVSDGSGLFLKTGALDTDWGKVAVLVSGVLPIASGGTNSGTALNNNRIMISSGGAIVEHSAQTSNFVAFYNASGLPSGQSDFRYRCFICSWVGCRSCLKL